MKSCDDLTSLIKPVHRSSVIMSVPLYATDEFGARVLNFISVSRFNLRSKVYVNSRRAHPPHIHRVERPS